MSCKRAIVLLSARAFVWRQMYTVHFALRLLAPSVHTTLPGWFLQRTTTELQSARANGLMVPSTMATQVIATLVTMGLNKKIGASKVEGNRRRVLVNFRVLRTLFDGSRHHCCVVIAERFS